MALGAGNALGRVCCIASFKAVQARPLLVPPKIDFVAPRSLPGQPQARVLPGAVIDGLMRVVGIICPIRQIAGILVTPDTRNQLTVALVAPSPIKPQPVLHNRAAKSPIEVPKSLQQIRRAEPGIPERR